MSKSDPRRTAVLLVGAILEMSDHAQRQGGAKSVAGVAALHRMQSSIQKNRGRIIEMLQLEASEGA